MTSIRTRTIAGLHEGESFTITRTFNLDETLAFGDLTRDYNPVHYDQGYCAAKGLAGPILHGLLTGAMICEIGGQMAWLASGMDFRFLRPVYPGDTITLTVTITSLDADGRAEAKADYQNQHGDQVVTCRITGRLPMDQSRDELHRMVAEGDPTNPLAGS